jgi:hypothetical protein
MADSPPIFALNGFRLFGKQALLAHGSTRINNKGLIRVHPCESVAQIGSFRILLKLNPGSLPYNVS